MTSLYRAGRTSRGQPLILLGIIFAFLPTVTAQDIQWIRKFDDGMKLAREDNRPVLVDFWSQWCIPCGQADKQVYADPRLIEAFNKYVCIRVDVDAEPAIPRRFGIKSLPAIRFLDPLGTILLPIDKSATAGEFLEAVKSLPQDFEPLAVALGQNMQLAGQGFCELLQIACLFFAPFPLAL